LASHSHTHTHVHKCADSRLGADDDAQTAACAMSQTGACAPCVSCWANVARAVAQGFVEAIEFEGGARASSKRAPAGDVKRDNDDDNDNENVADAPVDAHVDDANELNDEAADTPQSAAGEREAVGDRVALVRFRTLEEVST
jgi:hypothetical protein